MKSTQDRPYYFTCKQCGANEEFYLVEGADEGSEATGCLIFLTGGLIPYMLYSGNAGPSGPRVLCGNCGHLFPQPGRPISPLSKRIAFWWIMFLAFGPVLLAVLGFLNLWPPLNGVLYDVFLYLVGLIEAYPFFMLPLLLAPPLISVVVYANANANYWQSLKSQYRMDVPDYSDRVHHERE